MDDPDYENFIEIVINVESLVSFNEKDKLEKKWLRTSNIIEETGDPSTAISGQSLGVANITQEKILTVFFDRLLEYLKKHR